MLSVQFYRKIFKKGQPTQSDSVFDRLQVDVGTVDPRTGREQAAPNLKLTRIGCLSVTLELGETFAVR